MELSQRQKKIIEIVRAEEPISGDNIAAKLDLTKPTLRNDLSLLTMTGILDAKPRVGYFYSGQTIEPLLFEELYHTRINEIMTPAIFIKQTLSIRDAATDLFLHDTGSLYVIDEAEQFVGIVSRKDLIRGTISNTEIDKVPVAMIMTRMPNVITIEENARVLDAGYIIMHQEVDSLPVTAKNKQQKVIGKISKTTLLNHFIQAGYEVEKNKEE